MTDSVSALVGNTPLLRLPRLSELTGCEILAKAEFMNPGGSVKDRTALGIISDAEQAGLLKPGMTIVEGTAGNTGIGLAMIGRSRGYSTLIVMNETQSKEKVDLLRAYGAEVRRVTVAPYTDPGNYNHVARRLAESLPSGFWANQFDNLANRRAHYLTTGPEIWNQTEGSVTDFVSGLGTGGTIAGVSQALKERNPKVRVTLADPYGASMWSHFKYGNLDHDEGDSITEGIGQARITQNTAGALVDDCYRFADSVIIEMLYHLRNVEGLCLGSSSAINVCGAVRTALKYGPGQTIVTILCDGGARYLSKLFNPEWLTAQNLVVRGLSDEELIREISRVE